MTTVHRVETFNALDRFSSELEWWAVNGSWIVFDLETREDSNSLEDWRPTSRIVSASFSVGPDEAWVVPLSHPAAPWADHWKVIATELFALLTAGAPKLVGQFVKYDTRWVRRHTGVDLGRFIAWDTKDGSFTLDENQPNGLKIRAVEDVGVEPWDADVNLKDAEQEDWGKLGLYNGLDTINTWRLFAWQREQFGEQRVLGGVFWKIALPAVRAFGDIEHHGMLLDPEETRRRRRAAEAERAALAEKLVGTVPDELAAKFEDGKYKPSLAPTSKFFKAYAEHHWPILECTKSCEVHGRYGTKPHPQPSWSKSVLQRLARDGYENAELLLQYRKLDTKINTYLSAWPDDVSAEGRLHTTYRTTTAVTGRCTSQRPNLNNVDRTLKPCFFAPPGWKFVQVDWSQIEVRLMAHVSGDENLKAVYQRGQDVYVMTAAAVFGVDHGAGTKDDPGEVTPDMRQKGKIIVLGFLFGMLAKSFVKYARDLYGLTFTEAEAEKFRNRFFDTYPGVLEYHTLQRRRVRKHKRVTDMFGRVRRLPQIDSPDQLERWDAERQAINFPIQGGAANLMLRALDVIVSRVRDSADKVRTVGSVYDSVLLEIRDDVLDPVLDWVGRVMTDPAVLWPNLSLTVPLEVEFEIGERWGAPDRTFSVSGQVELGVAA